MRKCFVIQPFDNGKFDRRYRETFEPAIRDAGFEPYRVDEDASANIPIDTIVKEIRNSDACFADITLDNPNVWFELGLALASHEDVCMVSSNERNGPYPFDVRHRQIVRYETGSAGDFEAAKNNIVKRLKAIRDGLEAQKRVPRIAAAQPPDGLAEIEIHCLLAVMQAQGDPRQNAYLNGVENRMNEYGYNEVGAKLALRKLVKKSLIEDNGGYDGHGYDVSVYKITEQGWDWLDQNDDKLILSRVKCSDADNDIAF